MKNTIPLIIAVVFGLAAVLAVSRTMTQKDAALAKNVVVLRASGDLLKGNPLKASDYRSNSIPADVYIAGQHVRYEDRNMVEGLKLNHDVQKGSFIMLSDFKVADSPAAHVGTGEWAVPVHFADNALLPFIQPGDEIGILVWLKERKVTKAANLGEAPKVTEEEEIRVLFPKKTVKDKMQGGVLLSLSREEAMTLLAAQRVGDLYPVLRNPDDVSANTDLPPSMVVKTALAPEVLMKLNEKSGGK